MSNLDYYSITPSTVVENFEIIIIDSSLSFNASIGTTAKTDLRLPQNISKLRNHYPHKILLLTNKTHNGLAPENIYYHT